MSAPSFVGTRLLLRILGADAGDHAPHDISVAEWMRYNAGMVALHLLGCLLAHAVLTALTATRALKQTGKVRPLSLRMSLRFICADFVTWFFISLTYALMTPSSFVAWSLDAPSVADMAASFLTLAVVQDLWHYPTHRYLHVSKYKWLRELHAHHHREVVQGREMNCLDVMNVNPFEYWVTIMPAYIAGFYLAAAAPAALGLRPNLFAVHMAVLSTYVIEGIGHSNVDIPLPFLRDMGFTVVSDHAAHHKKATVNFAIFFTFMDRLMGTFQDFRPSEAGAD
mmetsp:Transcript_4362/g.14536  ORF Transcript_4362/g.14536 Transcript_4362/m.14536 type:complete len:281 (+) Transcript_4362:61-903(+)